MASAPLGQINRFWLIFSSGRRSGGEVASRPDSPSTITARTWSMVSPISATRRDRPAESGIAPSTCARIHSAPARVLPAPRPPRITQVCQSPSGSS